MRSSLLWPPLDGNVTDEGVFTNAYDERVVTGNLGWNPGELQYGGGFGYESDPGDHTHVGLTLACVGIGFTRSTAPA